MRLRQVKIRNFRCYHHEIVLDTDDLTVLVGQNDAGKSALFEALAIFFNEQKLDADDKCKSSSDKEISITCVFDELPHSLVLDANYPTSLESEYLLNQDGLLEIRKAYNGALANPKQIGIYAIAVHPTVEGIHDLITLKNKDLKARAKQLGIDTSKIDPKINSQIRQLLWRSATDLDLDITEIDLSTENGKDIWTRLETVLPRFAYFKADRPSTDQDSEAQDPIKQAIKDALAAKEAELQDIATYVETQVAKTAERTLARLQEMDPKLASELRPRFSRPTWHSGFKVSLTGEDEIPVNKRGSGVRRLILLNFFRAKADLLLDTDETDNIIYAVEEVETNQHPSNQKMLIEAFGSLSEQPGHQILLTTHTPVLARHVPMTSIRYLEIDDEGERCIHQGTDNAYNLACTALGVLPDHNVRLFVGVEGRNDIDFLKGVGCLLRQYDKSVPDLQLLEQSGELVFIPLGGSSLALWVSRLKDLNRPEFYIFDRDTEPPTLPKYQKQADEFNARPNCTAVITIKREIENYIHPTAVDKAYEDIGITCPPISDYDDVPTLVAQIVHEASDSDKKWEDLTDEKQRSKVSKVKRRLNTQAVTVLTKDQLDQSDPNREIIGWFQQIKSMLDG